MTTWLNRILLCLSVSLYLNFCLWDKVKSILLTKLSGAKISYMNTAVLEISIIMEHLVKWYWQGKTEELGENPVSMPHCPTQISHTQTWYRNHASAVKDWHLATWIFSRPNRSAIECKVRNFKTGYKYVCFEYWMWVSFIFCWDLENKII